jgi:hypothetical protein
MSVGTRAAAGKKQEREKTGEQGVTHDAQTQQAFVLVA